MYDVVRKLSEPAGTVVAWSLVGNFRHLARYAQLLHGGSMLDRELMCLWDAPVHSAASRREM
jgi:phosphoenolpyruvate---glycerone phosphotransferase subunit DhaK